MKIAWFSCGITSAVATKFALQMYDNVEIFYIDITSQHSDNERFIKDCEAWFGQKINIVKSPKYADQFDVIKKTKYINGAMGARCTLELKKSVRYAVEKEYKPEAQIFGFEFSKNEINRAIRFKEQHGETNPLFPLIEKKLTKEECFAMLQQVGIKQPTMYDLGYNNNNCIGCVKGGKGYWNKIRVDFPDVFDRMAKLERQVNRSCLKDANGLVYLDELNPADGATVSPIIPDCGIFCQVELQELISEKTERVIKGELDIKSA